MPAHAGFSLFQQPMPKAINLLPGDLRLAIGTVVTARAKDTVSDISVAFPCGQADTDCSLDTLNIVMTERSRPCRKLIPVNFQVLRLVRAVMDLVWIVIGHL